MPDPENSLAGIRVLVTRPMPQGLQTAEAISRRGGTPVLFPVLEIQETDFLAELDATLSHLQDVDLAIMVSAAAVNSVSARLRRSGNSIPESVQVGVTGPASASLCEKSGISVNFVPEKRFDSEGLLECLSPYLDDIRSAVIFRGQSGREKLRTELEARGVQVRYQQCYRRTLTAQSIQPVLGVWREKGFDAVLVTSESTLDGLLQLLGSDGLALLRTSLVVAASNRIAEHCRQHDIERISVAGNASENSLIAALEEI